MQRENEVLKAKIKILEERIKLQDDKSAIHLKSIEKLDDVKNQLYRVELEQSETRLAIKMYAAIGAILVGLAGFLGRDYIDKNVSESIEQYAKPKVDSVIAQKITNDYIDSLVKKKAEEAITPLMHEVKKEGDAAIDEMKHKYETSHSQLLANSPGLEVFSHLSVKNPNLTEKIPKAYGEKLNEFEKTLTQLKTEAQYSYDDWYFKGSSESQKGQYAMAIVSFTRALNISPLSIQALFYRGSCYFHSKNYDKADEDFTKVIELYPKGYQAYVNRGAVYYYMGKYDKAVADDSMAIKLSPLSEEGYEGRADNYIALGQYDKALADINRIIESKPKNALDYALRAELYCELKQYDSALISANKAIELNPKNDEAYYSLGSIHVGLRDYNKAIEDFTKMIDIDPRRSEGYICLAGCYIIFNRFEDAQKMIQKGYSLSSNADEKAVCKWEQCIVLRLLKKDTKQAEDELNLALKEKFKLNWKLFGIEEWLEKANIDQSTKRFIQQKTDLLKAKM